MFIKVNQALHGYSEGHRELACSVKLPTREARLLLTLSDASGPGVTTVGLPYLTGFPLPEAGLYALSKTWPAPEMPRPGCVWTHTVLISFTDLASLDSPSALVGLFERPGAQSERHYGMELSVEVSPGHRERISATSKQALAALATAVYGQPAEQVWARRAPNVDYDDVVLRLWDQQWPRLRRSFRFCTLATRDRSQHSSPFDLQLVPGGESSVRMRFASMADGVEATTASDSIWLNDLLRDAEEPRASSLRTMLRRFGSDVLGGREAMRPLCSLHAALNAPLLIGAPIAIELAQEFPPLANSELVKGTILRASLENDSEWSADVLAYVLANFNLLNPDEMHAYAVPLASRLWANNPRHLVQLAYEDHSEIGGVLQRGIGGLDKASVLQQLPTLVDMAVPLVGLLPELAAEPAFWRETQSWPSMVSGDRVDLSAPLVQRAMVLGLREEGAINSALHVMGVLRALQCIHEALRGNDPIQQLSRWVRLACNDADGVAAYLAQATNPEGRLLLAIADATPPDSVPNEVGTDPWVIALYGLLRLEGLLPTELVAYGFRRALGWRSRSSEDLLSLTFEPLHTAAERSAVPGDSWNLLEPVLPTKHQFASWDNALRLREALARKCVERRIHPEHFLRLALRQDLMLQLMDAVWDVWGGPSYLKSVAKSKTDDSDPRRVSMSRLVADYVKRRSKLW